MGMPNPTPQLHNLQKLPPDRQRLFDQLFREFGPDAHPTHGPPSAELFSLADSVVQEFLAPDRGSFEYYVKPPIPVVFRHSNASRFPVYYYAISPGQPLSFAFEPDRRPDLYFLGSFLHPYQSRVQPQCSVQIDDVEVTPRRLGEKNELWYYIEPRSVKFTVRADGIFVRSWFVIHSIERKPIAEILREICDRAGLAKPAEMPQVIDAHTPQCRACRFNGVASIETAQMFNDPQCPQCFKNVVILELVWLDLMPRGSEEEEPQDVRLARAKFFDFFVGSVCWPLLESDWEKIIFGETNEGDEPVEELKYAEAENPVDAFIAEMERLGSAGRRAHRP
jgi:hypothetical protein